MLNFVWLIMIAVSIIVSLVSGGIGEMGGAAQAGVSSAVTLCLSLVAVYTLWGGLMEVAREVGLLRALARFMRPLVGRMFPSTRQNPAAEEAIVLNLSANLLGLGNAATPAGQAAMKALQSKERPRYATNEMVRLIVVNNTAITLLPTTVISMRALFGNADLRFVPVEFLVSLVATAVGLLACRLLEKKE